MVVMGEVLVPFGVRGWIKVRPFTETTDGLLSYRRWWLRTSQAGDWREMKPIDGRVHGETLLAQLAGIGSREEALALRGAEIAVPRSALPEVTEEEIYRADLIGLEVVNRDGLSLGRVADVQDFGAQPILRVVPADVRPPTVHLIPFVPAHVDGIDLQARRIDVDWTPGSA